MVKNAKGIVQKEVNNAENLELNENAKALDSPHIT